MTETSSSGAKQFQAFWRGLASGLPQDHAAAKGWIDTAANAIRAHAEHIH
ncbi:hypothetical protein [Allomesorhizobium camelthorni]|uniref:Uncharacterized protein n=1 Tax=Allomesorhizobium camelthorni TaxID=475069 RepID=A0A6G4WF19_9HYPH|nr:hypothetical protein [Mesorhizobium camelthorni]NGO53351.1 hypothetical protein [Mesorhizobium camelthorni]